MEERRMSKGNYRTSTVNERWGGGVSHTFITRPHGDQVNININILLFQCDTTKILRKPPAPPPSPPLISNKALNNERSFIL